MTKSNRSRKKCIPGKKSLPGKKGFPGKKKKPQIDGYRVSCYVTESLVIATVVMAALFLPQLIFRVEDNILCNDTTLGQRESMDVESLSTTYERSLAARMQNYAQGLKVNKKYYVTSQNLTVSDELTDYLYSDKGLYQSFIQEFAYYLIPFEIWEDYYSVASWKQYVIYSDDFEEGVNFILWYIEMQDKDGGMFKLLTDAEDGTIYGIKTEDSSLPGSERNYKEFMEMLRYGDGTLEAWTYFAVYYDAISDDMEDSILLAENMGIDVQVNDSDSGSYETEISVYDEEALRRRLLNTVSYQNETENAIRFLIPYGDAELDTVLAIEEQEKSKFYLFPDITVGIRQIYEMIPEFA